MKSLIRGAVRDHRLPSDYNYNFVQPWNSRRFLGDFKKAFKQRFITRQYATVPLFMLFGVAFPFFFFQSYIRMKQTGSAP